MRPPHYKEGTDKEHCGNCGAYSKGHCRMYSVSVEPEKVCDSWYSKKKLKLGGTSVKVW